MCVVNPNCELEKNIYKQKIIPHFQVQKYKCITMTPSREVCYLKQLFVYFLNEQSFVTLKCLKAIKMSILTMQLHV